jgi:REP element-mobilizing transposase RayT
VGFIACTYPFIEGEEEEDLVIDLCSAALEFNIRIIALNFCGDHVHAIIKSNDPDISKVMGLWKGKTAFNFNHKNHSLTDKSLASPTESRCKNLWAKSYYQRVIATQEELLKNFNYIKNNRIKHGLKPLSAAAIEAINTLVSQSKNQ